MGCDIHFYTEVKTTNYKYHGPRDENELSENRDSNLDHVLDNKDIKPRWITTDTWEQEDDGSWSISYDKRFYSGRNYFLFSVLADVRNGYNITPLSDPRGIPNDCCYPIKFISEYWNGDGHSHSYFTLKELMDIDWSKYEDRGIGSGNWLDGFKNSINKMKLLSDDPNNVRCVFFFDN